MAREAYELEASVLLCLGSFVSWILKSDSLLGGLLVPLFLYLFLFYIMYNVYLIVKLQL